MDDLKFALRVIRRTPATSGLIVLVLALGVCGNAATFSFVNALFLAPLPFAAPEQLVALNESAPEWGLEGLFPVAYPDFDAWRARNTTFQAMAAYRDDSMNHGHPDGARRMRVAKVTHDMAEVLAVTPILGRHIAPEEDVPGAPKVILLIESTWQRELGADPDVLGTTVLLDGEPYEVVGLLPERARFIENADAWIALATSVDEQPDAWYLSAIGRLASDRGVEEAEAELSQIHDALIEVRPANEKTRPVVSPFREGFVADYRSGTAALAGAVSLILLMACVNVAGLMLARATGRARELRVRSALGAPRGRLVRQLVCESFVLALAGVAAGAVVGHSVLRFAAIRAPLDLPAWIRFNVDTRFVAFAASLAVLTALASGLWPALQASRLPLRVPSPDTRPARRAGSLLVVSEVALAVTLLAGSSILAQSLRSLLAVDPGFRAEGVLTYRISLPPAAYRETGQRYRFFERHLDDVSGLPGVVSAGVVNTAPLGNHEGAFFEAEHGGRSGASGNPTVLARITSAGYFRAIGLELLSGRLPEPYEDAAPVALVNRSFARTFWSDGQLSDVPGKRIRPSGGAWLTVIGVVDDVKHYGLDAETAAGVYTLYGRAPGPAMTVVARTNGPPDALVPAIRSSLAQLDSSVPIYDVSTMSERLDRSLWLRRTTTSLSMVFALYALLLAGAGVYGVVSTTVSGRRREIGIRLALGAERRSVVRTVFAKGMGAVAAGTGLGLAGSFAVRAVLSSHIFGVATSTTTAALASASAVVVAASLSIWLPARRAARTDIAEILRAE